MKALAEAMAAFRSGEGLKGQLVRGGVGSVVVKFGANFISIALSIVLARTLGARGLGIYSFVLALVTVLAIPAQMGLPNLVVRETAKGQVREDWALIRGIWRWATTTALAISLGLMTLGAVMAWVFAGHFSKGQLAVFHWGLVLVPLVALGNLRGAALRGLRHVVLGQLPEFILRPAFLIVLILGAEMARSAQTITASDAMMLHALASALAFIIGAYLLLRARPSALREERRATIHPRLWLASALPLGMVEGMQLINQNVGVIALGILAKPEDVAIYRIALQGGMLVSFGLTVTNMVVGPYISRFYEQRRMELLQTLVTAVTRAAFLISLAIAFVFVVAGPYLISFLFGIQFANAYIPLIIISAGQVVNSFTGCVGQILYMSEYEGDVAKAVATGAFCNVALVFLLGPYWGYAGVAIAMTTSVFIWNAILALRVWQRTRIIAAAYWKA